MKVQKFVACLFAVGMLLVEPVAAQVVTTAALTNYASWPRFGKIAGFYEASGGRLAWVADTLRQKEFLSLIQLAPSVGLNEADYQAAFLQHWQLGAKIKLDTIDADVRFTDAALHFFTELKNGNQPPSFRYDGLRYAPDDDDLVSQLKDCLTPGSLRTLMAALQPRSKEYSMALNKLNQLQRIASGKNFNEAKIVSTKVDSTNGPLVVRLYQLGIVDSVHLLITKKELVKYLKLAQTGFDLLNDGVLRSTTSQALNTPIHQRIQELKLAVNTFRWLEELKRSGRVLLLNISSATLFVYDSGKLILTSRVIAGKASTPTPTLTSTINEVILYPYWMVPHKIAVNELLPSIKRNVAFLAAGNFQVLIKQGKVLNPYAINWRSLSKRYFPYIIRQSTGCDNALGLVKFNFYNPFTVYLHDTPTKTLFASKRRFFSHGCMRVEKPEELAHLLLGSNRIAIDTLTAKGCIYQQSPVTVKVEKPLPVMVLYSTVWYTKEGELRFYSDVYNKLNFSTAIASNQ